jgi:hypothetical protein
MKTYDEIDPCEFLALEDFKNLFSPLPLLDSEISELSIGYYPMYTKFIEVGVSPKDSWLAVRNIFIVKNDQIGLRIKQ